MLGRCYSGGVWTQVKKIYCITIMPLVKYPHGLEINYIKTIELSNDPPYKTTSNGGIWEKKIYKIYQNKLKKHKTAIDVGAYIGTHTLPMSSLCKKVYSFEPNPALFSILKSNIKTNNIENVVYLPTALSDKNGMEEMDCRMSGTSRFRHLIKKHRGFVEKVVCKRLDDLLPEVNDCCFMKIDCEGAEFQVLEGAVDFIDRNRPTIVIEVFRIVEKRKMLQEWCENNAYNITHIGGDDFLLEPMEY